MEKILALCTYFTGVYLLGVILTVINAIYQKIVNKASFFSELNGLNPYTIGKAMSDNSTKQMIAGTAIFVVLILGILNDIVPRTPFGSEEIGGLFEKNNYSAYYYVLLFPDDSDSKNYKVIAEIEADGRDYTIERAYLPEGGYVTFNDLLFYSDEKVAFNQKIRLPDEDDNVWEIQLLNERPTEYALTKIKQ